MKSTSKKLSETKVELKVTLDAADLKDARQKAVERLAKEIEVQGFRKGKVPASVAEKHLSDNVINNATRDMAIRESAPKAFAEAKVIPIVAPQAEETKFVPDEVLEYTATAEIFPEVKLGDFKKLKVDKESTEASEEDVQEIVDNITKAYAEKAVTTEPATMGDEVIIDFVGKEDGEEFAGGSAKDFPLVLGSGQFIPGFEEGIVSHKTGDKFDLELAFPKDYHNKTHAGKKVVFETLLKQVNQIKTPELNDELAAKCGPFKTVAELRADIKKNLEMQNSHRANEKYRDDLVGELVKKSKLVAPEVMINGQLQSIRNDAIRNAASHRMSFEDYLQHMGLTQEEWEKSARGLAEDRVKASLVLQTLALEQGINATDKEVSAKINELKDLYGKSPEAMKNLKDPRVREDIKGRLIIDKTVDFLVDAVENGNKSENKASKK